MHTYEELCKLRDSMPKGPERQSLKDVLYFYAYGGRGSIAETLLGKEKTEKEKLFLKETISRHDFIFGTLEVNKGQKVKEQTVLTTGNTINFRDWIMCKANRIGKSVVINEADFDLLAKHYKNFILVEPEIAFRIKRDKKDIEAQQEKIEEDIRYIQANCNDKEAYGAINLSYPQWKRVGRFVKQGEKSTFYTLDAAGVKYALFSFNQTDVAEDRYKSIKPRCENAQTCTCLDDCEDKR